MLDECNRIELGEVEQRRANARPERERRVKLRVKKLQRDVAVG